MRCFFISLFLLTFSFVFSQQSIGAKSYVMNDKSDYSFLDNVLKNKRIVLLGEQTHGDGATFDEKVKIVKHLNNTLGFNTIVFESGLKR
jgi:erythromycin esterase-like protein